MGDDRWSFARASVMGTSHVKSGMPCQDYAATVLNEDAGRLMLVVCDGAGSARHSAVGSARVAENLIEFADAYFGDGGDLCDLTRGTVLGWLEQIKDDLIHHAAQFDRTPRDYACTLLAAIIGREAAAFLQIGDGAMVVSHGQGDGWAYIHWPQHGEYANSTNFVLGANLPEVLHFEVVHRRINEVAVFSDGIENLVLHFATKTVHEPFFEQMLTPLRTSQAAGLDQELSKSLAAYLASPTICQKTDDDKTLVLATRCHP